MNIPDRNYSLLDAVAVIGSLTIVAGVVVGLFAFKLDPAVAPIVSALATAVLGIPVSYGAFRWGSSVGAKASAATMAQLAGAGPPPPAAPLTDEEPKP